MKPDGIGGNNHGVDVATYTFKILNNSNNSKIPETCMRSKNIALHGVFN